jgi:hypothetical protein
MLLNRSKFNSTFISLSSIKSSRGTDLARISSEQLLLLLELFNSFRATTTTRAVSASAVNQTESIEMSGFRGIPKPDDAESVSKVI